MAAAARFAPGWLQRAYIKRLLVTWQHPENALFDDGAILRGEVHVSGGDLAGVDLGHRVTERFAKFAQVAADAVRRVGIA